MPVLPIHNSVAVPDSTIYLRPEYYRSMSGREPQQDAKVILIVAKSSRKGEIMRAIMEKAGLQTKAGAICFSLPVTEIAGLRRLDEEEEEPAREGESLPG